MNRLRIAFLGNFDAAPYTSENHHAKSLESLGHKVYRLQEGKATTNQISGIARASNMFVWVHTHGWTTPGGSMKKVLEDLKRHGIPTVTYHLDLWFGLNRQDDMKKDDVWNIEHFFTVDKLMADWFNEQKAQGKGVTTGYYLPAGVFGEECYYNHPITIQYVNARSILEGQEITCPKIKYEHEIIFVGSKGYHSEWNYRPQLIDWLQSNYGNSFELWGGDGKGVVRGKELNELYAKTKIVIGDTLCINYDYPFYYSDRLFEVLGRGGFMIFPFIKGIDELFEDRKHIVYYQYGNFGQLKELIEYYLSHDEEREAIRLAGHKEVKEKHNYKVRWEQILKTVFPNG